MTKEEKQLLLNDLCARLPYGVKIDVNGIGGTLRNINVAHLYYDMNEVQDTVSEIDFFGDGDKISIERIKPYLRPMSSMTDEEKYIYRHMLGATLNSEGESIMFVYEEDFSMVMDWLNSRHFDYRGLIEKGLALEAPEGMYKTD